MTCTRATRQGAGTCRLYTRTEQVQKVMFPDASAFREHNVALTLAQMRQVEKLAALPARSVNWRVFGAYREDALLGFVVLDDVVGKFELIAHVMWGRRSRQRGDA